MSANTLPFSERLAALQQPQVIQALAGIQHGIEREALRINPDGTLAQTPHGKALGSALCHPSITTDFSEALLEFITDPHEEPRRVLAQLGDIQRFVQDNIGEERLWPVSMPCYIDSEENIPIANFGKSNAARMKSLYRVGLKNRYGSMMQAIAGVHYNFSLPPAFWQAFQAQVQEGQGDQDSISAGYFQLIRNYRQLCWLIPYLYGASPAMCGSFLDEQSKAEFSRFGKGSYYLPYATSLRMSDLGYTNNAQSGLNICYNSLEAYIASLRDAIRTPSNDYARFSGKKDGEYQQLNSNVLQIENELYSPIRPKQPTQSLEKPTDALERRGVSYIEVRALDVNPFTALGVSLEQFHFLDVFLLYCAVRANPGMTPEQYQETEDNMKVVVKEGRRPGVQLTRNGQRQALTSWAEQLFNDLAEVAKVLDRVHGGDDYSRAVHFEKQKIHNPDLTPSARMLHEMRHHAGGTGQYALNLAENYRQHIARQPYHYYQPTDLVSLAQRSLQEQQAQEDADSMDFDAFLQDYFKVPDKSCA
ncbi:Glutamate--cysteine ligase [Saliniradius amylolyticus]|uniref:Glutamate--cysteine ligase n=1 Tax=Saliniradius amylolyticus TaxID=2183582 RepID=A0A2S2E482_9ALTE|nr:glutamate--cysteine ligase [Saliniradius amylolyticus]AWL12443.1 Glutamate--cysteine ligase [Saliniradius amylolyticus]